MIHFLKKRYIKNYRDVKDPYVRQQYAKVASVVSIICNIFLCAIKLFAGFVSNSISIQADAFNNLSDAGSNVATLLGFQLSNKQPDRDHPYGHGRYEYIMGLVIAFLIFMVAFNSFKESLTKMIHPQPLHFNYVTIVILILSILIKLWMGYLNKQFGKTIDSPSLNAAGQDSMNDCVSTAATLISVIFTLFSDFCIDGYIGIFVSVFVFKAGLEVFNETVNPLLGQAPDPQLIKEISRYVLSKPGVIGIHDLIVHDYGPSRLFISLHVEIRADENILEAHDMIDAIEREMNYKFKCLTVIHMDPIDISDEKTNRLREMTSTIVKEINENYSIHDFRIVSGPTHTNLIFDVVLPAEDRSDERELREIITSKIREVDKSYFTVIEIDHSYV